MEAQWSPTPLTFYTRSSASKIMAPIFCNTKWFLVDDTLHKTTIIGEYYTSLVHKLWQAIKAKC